jgi:hypothetical protein
MPQGNCALDFLPQLICSFASIFCTVMHSFPQQVFWRPLASRYRHDYSRGTPKKRAQEPRGSCALKFFVFVFPGRALPYINEWIAGSIARCVTRSPLTTYVCPVLRAKCRKRLM